MRCAESEFAAPCCDESEWDCKAASAADILYMLNADSSLLRSCATAMRRTHCRGALGEVKNSVGSIPSKGNVRSRSLFISLFRSDVLVRGGALPAMVPELRLGRLSAPLARVGRLGGIARVSVCLALHFASVGLAALSCCRSFLPAIWSLPTCRRCLLVVIYHELRSFLIKHRLQTPAYV